jgi:nicotinate-nucleotide adenylyltransferase
MPKPSYTIDTLAFLSDKHPHHEFKLVIGGDNLKRFHKWKNSNVILDLYGLYVYPRPRETHPIDHENVLYIPSPLIDLSATFIRNAIKNGHSVKYLLPPLVEDFIRDKKFFLD